MSCLLSRTVACNDRRLEALVSLYDAEKDSLTAQLTPQDLSKLVAILGTCSLPSDTPESTFHANLHVDRPFEREYWELVDRVLEDKACVPGYVPTLEDDYWQMEVYFHYLQRRRFASTSTFVGKSLTKYPDFFSGTGESQNLLKEVTLLYQRIRMGSRDPAVHYPYFRTALVASRAHLNKVATALTEFMKASPSNTTPHIVDLFWRMIDALGPGASLRLQEQFLDVTSKIVGGGSSGQSNHKGPVRSLTSTCDQVHLALASSLFPLLNPSSSTSSSSWARQLTSQALDDDVPHSLRWENLVLLATTITTGNLSQPVTVSQLRACPKSRAWRTLLFLSFLRKTLGTIDLSSKDLVSKALELRLVLRQVWEAWISFPPELVPPPDVHRQVLLNFFEVSGRIRDEEQLHLTYNYALGKGLCDWSTPSKGGSTQALDMAASYATALIRCRGYSWEAVIPYLQSVFPDKATMTSLIAPMVDALILDGHRRIISLYEYLTTHGLQPSTDAYLKFAVSLVKEQRWSTAIPFLSDPRFTHAHKEMLLISFLRVPQTERWEVMNYKLGSYLGNALLALYRTSPPSPYAKYPIRYFLKPLIAAGHGPIAVDIMALMFRHDQEFFTQRSIRRYLVQLLQRRNAKAAMKLFFLVKDAFPGPGIADLSRKFALAFSNTRSPSRAARILQAKPMLRFQTPREEMLRTSVTRTVPREALSKLYVISVLKNTDRNSPSFAPAVRFAVSFLVKHGRTFAARKLYGWASSGLDPKTHTAIGNIILHGCYRLRQGEARTIRHLVHTRDVLSKAYQFTPDRATVNIIVKIILGPRSQRSSRQIRALFDEFVRRGYPAGEEWRREHGVPFGTPPASSPFASLIPATTQTIAFRKHLQPLYRMFISAFRKRKDFNAMKTVGAILREERRVSIAEIEKRNQARREGIMRKKARLVARSLPTP
ncbi:hypothetical protein CC1G_07573 [Coprinopsis cinerea okayama7|uniref:Uncharacterized protein n=1 Tax=Coprinopsis cinerea (strain Okayama-7 / 130 / ATCC MYA-4618 / FGSC 9003) TaxID=240176 RepID=A8NUM8_COPC7|nr:hypothetical protein CC1G_07573 [Coprinopsis cinerea okayama7\|eukprot:XP_001836490.2 hypothetical protein CC1G_07573 [Coprinopsis cinerea okayama7\